MTDFEQQLRERLAAAATAAPQFRQPAGEQQTSGRRSWQRSALAVAAAVIVVGGSVTWWSAGRGGDHPGEAICAAELVLDGTTYVGRGPTVRVPRPGPALGTAHPVPCRDGAGRPVTAYTVPGVPATDAILTDDGIWVDKDLSTVPAAIRELDAPVPCDGTGPIHVTGTLDGVDAQPTGKDYAFRAPYTAHLIVTAGTGVPLDRFRSVAIDVAVTTATTGGDDTALLRAALGEGRAVNADLRCEDARFEATAWSLAPQ